MKTDEIDLLNSQSVPHKLVLHAISNLAPFQKIMMFHTSTFYCGFC